LAIFVFQFRHFWPKIKLMISVIKQELLKIFGAKEVELLKIRGGSNNKLVFFVFFNGSEQPAICLKMSSTRINNYLLRLEFDNLKSVYDLLPANLKNTIPQPDKLLEIDGYLISLEEAVIGRQLSNQAAPPDLKKVFDWLCQFHKSNIISEIVISKNYLINLLACYQNSIQLLKNKRQFWTAVKNLIEQIWPSDVAMPLIRQHGDFHFGNIYFKEDKLKVVDWANYNKVTLPAYDATFFLRRQSAEVDAEKWLTEYFIFFSLPKDLIPAWRKLLLLIEGLEKLSRTHNSFSQQIFEEYFRHWFQKP